jgi:hypothetical protein
MKIIKEHINEKFEEESDPVTDMGIGLSHLLKEKIESLQTEKGVGSINIKDDKLMNSSYYIEIYFYNGDLKEATKMFYKHIDSKYIENYFYKSIGSLKVIMGFVIKNEYEEAFVKAFKMIF